MRTRPLADYDVVLKLPMLSRAMSQLAHETNLQLRSQVPHDRETQRIAIAFLGQAWAVRGVSQVAIRQFVPCRLGTFVAGGTTIAMPCAAKRKADWMKKTAAVY
jgi:hypothetical protein